MLRSLRSAIDDALDILYEPNAVFSQFLGSASMTVISLILSVLPLLVFYFLAVYCLFFYFLSFVVFAFLSFLFLALSSSNVFFFQLTCVCRANA